jgi:pimeloyl-ACP methyl ester carboxylesterase
MTGGMQAEPADGPVLHPGGRSHWVDLGGPVHFLDFGGPPRGPVIVCVHGLGGSAVNWSALAPLLTGHFRVVAPDLAGHGLTQSLGRGTEVTANRALLHRFIESVAAGPVILMGNSMGGMISLLEVAASPRTVAGLILIDPALPFVRARFDLGVAGMFVLSVTPGIGRVLAGRQRRLSAEEQAARVLALCCVDPSRIPAPVITQHLELARKRAEFTGTGPDFEAAMRSVLATAGYRRGQAYRHGIRSIGCPVLLVHGARDRLVPVGAARTVARANPSWSLVVLPGVGHVPHLEAPEETARVVAEWLGSAGRPAAAAAVHGPPGGAA